MASITLFDIPYSKRREMQSEMQHWLNRQQFTQSITLSTHDPMCSVSRAVCLLDEWGKRMDRQIIGNRKYKREAEQGCEWVAFLEGIKSAPHWHVLFRLSPDLAPNRVKESEFRGLTGTAHRGKILKGLEWVVHKKWNELNRTGDADCKQIYSNYINFYDTKFLSHSENFDSFKFSPAFKNRN